MARTSLPRTVKLEVDVERLSPGLVGLVRAVAASIHAQDEAADADELLCISSAAFANYVFDPEYNLHEEVRREYSPYADLFSNYGPWASIGYYTGWQIREVSSLASVDLMKLVAFELALGRPIVMLDESLQPGLLTSYDMSSGTKLVADASGRTWNVDEAKFQDDDEVFDNWMLLVRPGEQEEWAASAARQRIDVLRWTAEHGRNRKEFFQETRENYAPGLMGIQRFRTFLEDLTDPGGVQYADAYTRRLRDARGAAGRVLPRWVDSIVRELAEPDVAEPLHETARQYARVEAALSADEPLVDAFEVVEDAERRALEALEVAVRVFPSPFEA